MKRTCLKYIVLVCFAVGGETLDAQTISSLSPNSGRPGTQVEINGGSLGAVDRVEFGQVPADFIVLNATRIRAVVPDEGLSGPVTVRSGNQSANSPQAFFVSPRISSFEPPQGAVNTMVTIDGANFISGATVVKFGSITSQVATVTAPSQISAVVPVGVTNGPITVQTFAGFATSRVDFVSTTAPLISNFEPKNGFPGTIVVIDGANFFGVTAVKFNGVSAGFTRTSDTQIQATVPANATTGPVTITTGQGTAASDETFLVGPTLFDFTPSAGVPGTEVVVNGNNFNGLQEVRFGSKVSPQVTQTAQTQLRAVVPNGATNAPITVVTSQGTGVSSEDFVVGPLIDFLSAYNGPVGASIVINGSGFAGIQGVFFGGVKTVQTNITADTQIHATVPVGATSGPVRITTLFGTNETERDFLVTTAVPFVSGFEPRTGPRGTQVTLSGANFIGATGVFIGGVSASGQVTSDTQILLTVPPGARTGFIRVQNASGSGQSPEMFFVPPQINRVSPSSAIVGEAITLSGTNLLGATAVYFRDVAANILTVSSNALSVEVPAHARTGELIVETPAGAFITSSNFVVLPKITGFSPTLGPVGTSVEISGTTFVNVTNVQFNGVNSSFTLNSAQSITATVPGGASTGPVRVGTRDGASVTATNFTVTVPTDLAVSQFISQNPVAPGTTFTITALVENRGPSINTGVVLTNTFPSGFSVLSAAPSRGGCEVTGNNVGCSLGILTNGLSASVQLQMRSEFSGVYTNRVRVRSVEGDTVPSNNQSDLRITVFGDADRTLRIRLLSAQDRVVVSWPVSGVPFQLQSIPGFGAGIGWSNVLQNPVVAGSTNVLTNEVLQSEKYYRLMLP